jgi:thiamine biosynthesis protein ThiS
MIIQFNGLKETIPAGLNISELIKFYEEGDPHVIVEQNGRYIYPKDYDTCMVMENDVIEFINPNLGG